MLNQEQDFLATFTSLAGGKLPDDIPFDSEDMLPVLRRELIID